MLNPILLHAVLALTLAAPAISGPDPAKAGPPITIDTGVLTGGVAGQVLLGPGLVVVDPTTGVVHLLGTQRSTSAMSPSADRWEPT